MIVLGIITILATFSFQNYSSYLAKNNRFPAQIHLLKISAATQEYYSLNSVYPNSLKDLYELDSNLKIDNENYEYSLEILDNVITFVAKAIGKQKKLDQDCHRFSVDINGKKLSEDKNEKFCW